MPPLNLVYKYALLPPTESAEVVDEQMFAAHRYYNKLIEIERERRAAYYQLMLKYADIECLTAWKSALHEARNAVRDEIKEYKNGSGKKRGTKDQCARAAETTLQITEVATLLQEAKKAKKQDVKWQAIETELNLNADLNGKAARGETAAHWGSYLLAEAAIKQAKDTNKLAFKRWGGYGRVGVQLQGGLSTEEAISCQDTRLQLDMKLRPCGSGWQRKDGKPPRRTGKPRPRVRLRVLSETLEGKRPTPIWAEWPVILHRPLPPDAIIKWAVVSRTPEPGKKRHRWSLLLSIELPAPEALCDKGVVSIDVGWRHLEDGGLRVAYLLGDDKEGGPLELDQRVINGLQKSHDLQSIRDKRLDDFKAMLVPWLKQHRSSTPDWFKEATTHLHKWRSTRRFHKLAWQIREADDASLDEIRELFETWRRKDKHLYSWQVHQRDSAYAHRLDVYRNVAADLASRYQVLVVEDIKLNVLKRKQKLESKKEDKQNRKARRQMNMAAPGELRTCLVQAFARRGGIVAFVPPQYTSKKCNVCGVISPWNDPGELIHRCAVCNAVWDRDKNACRNLIDKYRERFCAAWASKKGKLVDYSEITARKEGSYQRLKREKQERSQAAAELAETKELAG